MAGPIDPTIIHSLLLLAFLAHDALAGILHALALVGLGTAILADFRGHLADLLLVDARHGDFRRLRHGDRDARRGLIDDVVAEAQRELQVLALQRCTIADAADLELLLEAFLHAVQDVDDLGAGHAPFRSCGLRLVARLDGDVAVFHLDQYFVVDDELQLALRTLRRHGLAVDSGGHALRQRYGFLANTRHCRLLVFFSVQPIRRSGKAL